jgi:shikimate dehydrogenase
MAGREGGTAAARSVMLLGVVGESVGHSLSPAIHTAAFRHLGMAAAYLAFDVPATALARALAGACALGVVGLNVTAPHKERAYELATRVGPAAAAAGAANVLRLGPDGAIDADSTDGYAIVTALTARRPEWAHALTPTSPALVLGAGGVGRTAAVAIAQAGAAVRVAARRPEAAEAVVGHVRSLGGRADVCPWSERGVWADRAPVVVQATPLGGGARPRGDPLPHDALPADVLVELAYGPAPTPLEARSAAAGRTVVDGREILARQGARSWRLWFGIDGPLEVMLAAVRAAGDGR